jgi:putative addiction module CopG family antidote
MQIDVTSEAEIFIKQKLMEGIYSSPQEIVDEAINLLKEKEVVKRYRIAELNSKLKAGMKSLSEGAFLTEHQVDKNFSEKFNF